MTAAGRSSLQRFLQLFCIFIGRKLHNFKNINFRTNFRSLYAIYLEASYANQKKYLEILGRIKFLDTLYSHFVHNNNRERNEIMNKEHG